MINKKIAISTISILTSLMLMGGATFAFFSDSATSTGNTFSTGSADVQIAEDVPPADPGTYAGSITGVTFSDITPGFTMDKDFWIKNNSTGTFSMDATADLNNLGGISNGTLPDELMVKFTCDTDKNGLGTGNTTTIEKSVNSWITDAPVALGTLGPNEGASNATIASDQDELLCRMTASLSVDADNTIAGKDLSFDGVFDATQVAE